MNNKEAKIFAADLGANIPELDLHGFYPDEVIQKLEQFLFFCYKKKIKMVRVIYGGGTGKLCEVVLQYLKKHPQVEDVVDQALIVFTWSDFTGSISQMV